MSDLKIGMIGLDTSHCIAFAKLLNDANNEFHVPGGKIVVAYPGGSPDFELSASRVEGYTKDLRDNFGLEIVDSPEAVAEASDAILLESVDGRVHLEQFRKIAPYGKPVFVDKPFAVSSDDANKIVELAKQHEVPLLSASALRYAEGLSAAINDEELGEIIGADMYGPMAIVDTQPGFFWYGIHSVEMVFATMGKGCKQVRTISTEDHDVIVGEWEDGRTATVRGNRKGNNKFGGTIHREKGSAFVDVYANPKPYYASLLERVMQLFLEKKEDIDLDETLEIIRFIEAANESRETGNVVKL